MPIRFERHVDLEMELRRRVDGATFRARAVDGFRLVAWTLLLPVSVVREQEGAEDTYRRMARHLYASVQEQGAFRAAVAQ